jgi:hypothetical protein
MSIEKILVIVDDREYSLSVEIMSSEDGTIYRATPDQNEGEVEHVIHSYIDFDENGLIQSADDLTEPHAKEVTEAVWRGIKEQIIGEHVSFNRPL